VFIDTETKSERIDEKTLDLSLLLACYECWIVDENGLPIAQQSDGVLYNEGAFFDLIKASLPCRVVAHNWRFDATVLRIGARDNLQRHGYDIDLDNSIIPVEAKGFTPFLISLNFDGRKAELVCNTNYYKQSLASLGDNFGTHKMTMPDTNDLEAMTEYCANDVKVLRESYFFLFGFTQELADTTPGTTIAMSANRVYRNRYMPNKRIQGTLSIPYITDIEQEAYRGGRTDSFFTGTPDKTIYKYDVNSLYPYSMLGDMPIRYVQRSPKELVIRSLELNESRFLYLSDVTISIPESSIYSFIGGEGIKNDKRELIFPIGEYRCWVWEPMLRVLYNHGFVKEIHLSYAYNKFPIFDDYVLSLYRMREEYKLSGDKSRDLLVKILLNSLYGKFGQREHLGWELADAYEAEVMHRDSRGIERFQELWDGEFVEYLQVADTLYRSVVKDTTNPSANSVTSIAGYITTMARSILWETMAGILESGGQLYYCDTDSIFSSVELPDSLVSDTELGKWKLEEVIEPYETEFVSPKHYRIADNWTIKGIRNPQDKGPYTQEVFPNFITDLTSKNLTRRKRLESGAMIVTIIKSPTGLNNKRIYGGKNSPTYPIVLG